MKNLLSLLFVAFGALALASPQAPSAPQAPPVASCPCIQGSPCECGEFCACVQDYEVLYAKAMKENRPLVVWVGSFSVAKAKAMPARCLHYRTSSFAEAAPGSIVVGVPAGSQMNRHDFASNASAFSFLAGARGAAPVFSGSVRFSGSNC
jgi:hypothetical protein